MRRASKGNDQEALKQKLLDILDEEESASFSEIRGDLEDAKEEEIREALLDLLDKNRVVANADWEYRQRTLEA